jgi:CRISPR-associated protein Csb2
MLAFGIRYLNGFVAARTTPDDRQAEWPPHPARIFMALVAAHFLTDADEKERARERDALLWLQSLERNGEPAVPSIIASDALHRTVVTHYVPVNDHNDGYKIKNKKIVVFPEIGFAGVRRERQDRTFARAWLTDDKVFFLWPGAEPDGATRSGLESLCGKVTRIGHSSSLVQMWVANEHEIGEPNWVPDENRAIIRLRIAPPGTLEYLAQRFNGEAVERFASLTVVGEDSSDKKRQKEAKKRLKEEFPDGAPAQLRPSLSVDCGYARSLPPKGDAPAVGSIFSPHLVILKLQRQQGPYRHLDLSATPLLAQRWRDALISESNDLPPAVRALLSGHDAAGAPLNDAHLAFLPLAFVGHEQADAHLLGVGIALPAELPRDERRAVLRALGRVTELKLGRLGVWRVETEPATRPPTNLLAETWTAYPRGATEWASVTPIAFDHHPKAKDKAAYQAEVAAMIRACCTRIGLPAPREVIVTPVSAHLGAPPAHVFPRLMRKDGSQRRHVHAILVFDQRICGPVILGAGRFRCYGVCRPLNAFQPGARP